MRKTVWTSLRRGHMIICLGYDFASFLSAYKAGRYLHHKSAYRLRLKELDEWLLVFCHVNSKFSLYELVAVWYVYVCSEYRG